MNFENYCSNEGAMLFEQSIRKHINDDLYVDLKVMLDTCDCYSDLSIALSNILKETIINFHDRVLKPDSKKHFRRPDAG